MESLTPPNPASPPGSIPTVPTGPNRTTGTSAGFRWLIIISIGASIIFLILTLVGRKLNLGPTSWKTKSGGVAIEGKKGQPGTVGLPEGFPAWLAYPGWQIYSNTKMTAPSGVSASGSTQDTADSVYQYYLKLLTDQGWSLIMQNQSVNTSGIMANKGSNTIQISIAKGQLGETQVNALYYSQFQKNQ